MKKLFSFVVVAIAQVTLAATPQVRNVKAFQQYPWGKVCISYEVEGNIAAGAEDGKIPFLFVMVKDKTTGEVYGATSSGVGYLSGDMGTAEGEHKIVWDVSAQGLVINSHSVEFLIMYLDEVYTVIDLSSGANSLSYPVSYLYAIPSDGWTDEYKSTKLVLRRIGPGIIPTHDASVTKPYYVGVFEVTQKQYELVMGTKPSYFSNRSCYAMRPVERVSYNMIRGSSNGAGWPASLAVDTTSFIGRLRAKTGINGFDLPTEAQWEYACRAGTTTDYNSGENCSNPYGHDYAMSKVGRYYSNGGNASESCDTSAGTREVGLYFPNAWGLYDMHGNVYEWCLDWNGGTISGNDPVGPSFDQRRDARRVLRGGCWNSLPSDATSSFHFVGSPSDDSNNGFGFRLVRNLPTL